MASIRTKVNTVPEEVTLVLSWEEFKVVATLIGSTAPVDVVEGSEQLIKNVVCSGDLLRPAEVVRIDKAPLKEMDCLWSAVGRVLFGGGYDGTR